MIISYNSFLMYLYLERDTGTKACLAFLCPHVTRPSPRAKFTKVTKNPDLMCASIGHLPL